MNLGRKVRQLRRARDLSQDDLAARVGISRVTISRFETGVHVPSIEVLVKIAGALGVKIDDLIEEESYITGKAEAPSPSGREERKGIKGPDPREHGPDRWRTDPEKAGIPEPGGKQHRVSPGEQVTVTKKTFDEVMKEIHENRLSDEAAWIRLKKDSA